MEFIVLVILEGIFMGLLESAIGLLDMKNINS